MPKRIVVPRGMYDAALKHQDSGIQCDAALRAALLWLSENPIVPTAKDLDAIVAQWHTPEGNFKTYEQAGVAIAVEWQRRMFLARVEAPVVRQIRQFMTGYCITREDADTAIAIINQCVPPEPEQEW